MLSPRLCQTCKSVKNCNSWKAFDVPGERRKDCTPLQVIWRSYFPTMSILLAFGCFWRANLYKYGMLPKLFENSKFAFFIAIATKVRTILIAQCYATTMFLLSTPYGFSEGVQHFAIFSQTNAVSGR